MSLEESIQENTAAIRQLIAALANQPLPLVAQDALAYAQEKAIEVEPPQEATPAKRTRQAKPVAVPADPLPTEPATTLLPYDAIKVPFLTKLIAKKGREAGAALLAEFGVVGGKLSDIPQERWVDVLESIEARCA